MTDFIFLGSKITTDGDCSHEIKKKTEKPLARFIKKKRKNQINKIRNEKGEVITDNAEIQRIIRDYYEQRY